MKRDIRIVALDLDGTTFNSQKIITKRTQDAISAAIDKGVIVMPATGRPFVALPKAFTDIPGVRYAITSNGGAVADLMTGEIICGNFMGTADAKKVVDIFLPLNELTEIYYGGRSYADRKSYNKAINHSRNLPAWFIEYIKTSRMPIDDLRERVYSGEKDIEKIMISFDDITLRQPIYERLCAMESISVAFGTEFNIEVTAKEATKGRVLKDFAERMGYGIDQVMACGDTMNDYSMLSVAGLAVAMGNADEEIKAICDYVTLSNDEDGVAHAIERFILD